MLLYIWVMQMVELKSIFKTMPEIREEIEYKGVSVIIPRRECVQTLNRKLRQKRVEKA